MQLWFIACPCWVVCIWSSIRGRFIPNKMLFQFFYAELKEYAKQNGVLELLVKPYETYQTFDSDGNPIDAEKKKYYSKV